MKTWVVLLRGINVGGKHIVPMKELREALEADGFAAVRTYIQSGNLVFNFPGPPETRIGEQIEKNFGFSPWVLALSPEELRQAAAANPFRDDAGKTVHFFFLDREPESVNRDLAEELRANSEQWALTGRVAYLRAPDGIGRSKLASKMDRVFPGTQITARNRNTVEKLLGMLPEETGPGGEPS
ncbi:MULTISPECIES: DUF1697 domain-containing protein [unclassified Robiginitalea]|uniref:DUF1697 domain-containing protein n=1 Tax=Robiginitalea TaxID=252306 RepID=UPI002349CE5A|nr:MULTISPECIES: DUF1697 domain-containing protein [unclassified Robiginitalea]MDC6355366.1 DUF1697 domain-containing protein [Robiginitalea sp. PM2]MDC6375419.1 DUF1697 domain-containing protein [Robiginitalea sp. SP8]